MRRRSFLRAAGAAALGSVGLVGTTTAVHETQGKPSHVTLSFDESTLETYRPKLITGHLDVRPTKQYAWLATSPEHDDDVYCYWTYYVTQRGVTSRDSHFLDREPLYVFVDEDTGEISEVIYSAYHWLAGKTTVAHTVTDADGEHPTFRVAEHWHHYLQTREEDGGFVDLDELNDQFDDWLANGWEEDLAVGAAQNPWIMRRRGSWWKDDGSGSFNELLAKTWITISRFPGVNFRGGANTDL